MVVVGALDQKPLILEPLERGLPRSRRCGARKLRMSGLGRPRADQPLPTLKLGVLYLWLHRILHLCDHVPNHKTWHPPGNHRVRSGRARGHPQPRERADVEHPEIPVRSEGSFAGRQTNPKRR
jgi:hypothetical protein